MVSLSISCRALLHSRWAAVSTWIVTGRPCWDTCTTPVRLGSLRYINAAGEALHPSTVMLCRKLAPNAHLCNAYGPTEASVSPLIPPSEFVSLPVLQARSELSNLLV